MTKKSIGSEPEFKCRNCGGLGTVPCRTCDGIPEQKLMCPICEWRGRQPCPVCRINTGPPKSTNETDSCFL